MARIGEAFDRIRDSKQPGLVAYVTAGDPDLARSAEILKALDRAGADVLEVGVPFSDPLADGPVIQRASERALASGSTLRGALKMIRDTRSAIDGLKTQHDIVEQIDALRDSVSGVSLDEEAVQMIKFQRAYEANARFFGTVDETLSMLFQIIGR